VEKALEDPKPSLNKAVNQYPRCNTLGGHQDRKRQGMRGMNRENTCDRSAQMWVTIAATALPAGWSNQYRTDTGELFHEPAAALLLQESRGQTRTVFATYENGCLEAACENPNYLDSLPPDSLPRPVKRNGPPPRPPENG
jgi:hypothetical protein